MIYSINELKYTDLVQLQLQGSRSPEMHGDAMLHLNVKIIRSILQCLLSIHSMTLCIKKLSQNSLYAICEHDCYSIILDRTLSVVPPPSSHRW